MKKISKILLTLILGLSIIFVASCDDDDTYKYPTKYQTISNGSDIYATFGENGFKISNDDLYYYLLSQYGVETLNFLVDSNLLTEDYFSQSSTVLTAREKELLSENKTSIMDNIEDDLETILLSGLTNVESDEYYYKKYYNLEYQRLINAYVAYRNKAKENDEKAKEDNTISYHFDDDAYVTWFKENYSNKTVNVKILTFDSEMEALNKINLANLNQEATYGSTLYSLDDLKHINTTGTEDLTLYNKALTLATGEYTSYPLPYGNRVYLMYCVESSESYTGDYAGKTDSEIYADQFNSALKSDIKDALYTDMLVAEFLNLSTLETTINKYSLEMRNDASLKIYYEGLEVNYTYAYDKVYSDLSITEYDDFTETTLEANDCVALWTAKDGSTKKLTADELYSSLKNHYAAATSLLFAQAYLYYDGTASITLSNGKYVKVDGSEAYDDAYEEAVEDLESDFEDGNYKTYGYPKEYGFDNFVRDYYGLVKTEYLVYSLDSELFESAETTYTNNFADICKLSKQGDDWYINYDLEEAHRIKITAADAITALNEHEDATLSIVTESNVQNLKVKYDVDGTATYALIGPLTSFYKEVTGTSVNVTVSGVAAYIDANLDGEADEVADTTAIKAKAQAIFDAAMANVEVDIDADSLAVLIARELREYRKGTSSIAKDIDNLRFDVISSVKHTSDDLGSDHIIQNLFDGFFADKTDLSGVTIDPAYRYTYTDDSTTKVGVISVKDADRESMTTVADNKVYVLIAVSATKVAEKNTTYKLSDLVTSSEATIRIMNDVKGVSISDASLKTKVAALADLIIESNK